MCDFRTAELARPLESEQLLFDELMLSAILDARNMQDIILYCDILQ